MVESESSSYPIAINCFFVLWNDCTYQLKKSAAHLLLYKAIILLGGCYNRVKFEFFKWHFHAPSHTIGEPLELFKIIFRSKKPPPTWKKLNWHILPYISIFSHLGHTFVYI